MQLKLGETKLKMLNTKYRHLVKGLRISKIGKRKQKKISDKHRINSANSKEANQVITMTCKISYNRSCNK